MKPNVSISYGFSEDNRYHLSKIPESIQLAIYKYKLFTDLKETIYKQIQKGNIDVKVIHLPLDTLRIDHNDALSMITELREKIGCYKFVIHPNKGIKSFLDFFLGSDPGDIILCVENFQWKKGKELRSPLQIIDFIHELRYQFYYAMDNIRLCFDTSHAEEIWFDYKLMSFLLPYINVIHLSNRISTGKDKEQHMAFNSGKGELNLVGFVKELVSRYKWSGNIVLEYAPNYHHKLIQNAYYLRRLIDERG